MTRVRAAVVTGLLVAAAVLGVAGPASAHNQVVSTTPAANATLTTLPAEFSITTNLPLLDVNGDGTGFAFEVRSAAGRYYGDGCLSITDATMSEKAALGPAGDYTVVWQLVSQDGHTVSGSYSFTWKPSGAFTPSPSHARPQNCGRAPGTASTAAPADPDAERSQTVPLADVLWIGGALLAVALAVVIAILVLSRRQSLAKRARNPQ
jgi:methionine-rich copper-binding protein CopC